MGGGQAVQVRVVQNKEPDHLLSIFKGKMVVHAGGKKSSFGRVTKDTVAGKKAEATDKDSYDVDGTRLFQVKGTSNTNVKATQVEEKACYLNSGDVFILECPKANPAKGEKDKSDRYIWCGTGCTGDEREFAKNILPSISPGDYKMILEDREPVEFWAALGGKQPFLNNKDVAVQAREPRLFQMSNAKGFFYAEEIFQWDQEDLIEDDVMLLDTGSEIFVWIGKGALVDEKKQAFKAAEDYVSHDPLKSRKINDVTFLTINQGYEPINFTGHFLSWNPAKWSSGKTYEQMKAEAVSGNVDPALLVSSLASVKTVFLSTTTYPYAELVSNPHESVDKTKKEQYLSDAEFVQYLGCTKADFVAMPTWKSSGLKKKAKLY